MIFSRKFHSIDINPIHKTYKENILWNNKELTFECINSRFFNPLFRSKAILHGTDFTCILKGSFRKITLELSGEKQIKVLVKPPMLHPFFTIHFYEIQLPEGLLRIMASRDSSNPFFRDYGRIIHSNQNRWNYLCAINRREPFSPNMFPENFYEFFSFDSIKIISTLCLWLVALSAPVGYCGSNEIHGYETHDEMMNGGLFDYEKGFAYELKKLFNKK